MALARSAPDLHDAPWDPADHVHAPEGATRPVVAMAGGRAFTFRYAETEELLRAAGCDVVTFDPLSDEALPAGTSGLYLGGGFPEVHATGLAANAPLRESLKDAVLSGMPTIAECAGLLYLCRTVDGLPMVGALDSDAVMSPRLTLSYRSVVLPTDQLMGAAGTRVTGHEFHRTTLTSPVEPSTAAWLLDGQPHGVGSASLHASYLHTHWAGHPQIAQRFADAVHAHAEMTSGVRVPAGGTSRLRGRNEQVHPGDRVPAGGTSRLRGRNEQVYRDQGQHRGLDTPPRSSAALDHRGDPTRGLAWHGDQELDETLVDFAVNVHDAPRPAWLDDALRASLDDVGAYPDASGAELAIARRHGRPAAEVLATAGAAEAFSLVARARDWRRPVVVHPQFTEPDAALLAAGHSPEHVLCDPGAGFRLDAALVPDDADLVMIGNPTNPTSVLHPERTIRSLVRPGRVVVVDEAFMDSVPGERGSLAGTLLPGLLVVRSLTKLWSIPGVRAGYVLGDRRLLAELRAHQSPWSVSAQAIAAMTATASEEARAEAAARATVTARNRAVLTDGLTELGIHHVAPAAPFVLAKVGRGTHARLREAGYAVRRADTFPGLDDSWVRLAVRRPDTTRKLLAALRVDGLEPHHHQQQGDAWS